MLAKQKNEKKMDTLAVAQKFCIALFLATLICSARIFSAHDIKKKQLSLQPVPFTFCLEMIRLAALKQVSSITFTHPAHSIPSSAPTTMTTTVPESMHQWYNSTSLVPRSLKLCA